MCRDVSIIVLILLSLAKYSVSVKYEYILEDESIFSECHNKPEGYYGLNKFMDFSNATLNLVEGGIEVAGPITTLWDNEPTDIVQVSLSVTYLDRGVWQPTLLDIKYDDVCSAWDNEKTLFYQYTSHVVNIDVVKRNCVNVAGTQIIMEPFLLSLTYDFRIQLRPGRYRATYLVTGKDRLGNPRPTPICIEANGSFERLRTK